MVHGQIFLGNDLRKFFKSGWPPVFEDILSLPLILVLHESEKKKEKNANCEKPIIIEGFESLLLRVYVKLPKGHVAFPFLAHASFHPSGQILRFPWRILRPNRGSNSFPLVLGRLAFGYLDLSHLAVCPLLVVRVLR